MRRHPIDNCLSLFALRFGEGFEWSHDLGQFGRCYRAYESLMAPWRAVLPDGATRDVRHEDMGDNFEAEACRIVAYCGLGWTTAARFHQTQHPVLTASATHIRQPIYRSSVGRWQPTRIVSARYSMRLNGT